MCMMRLFEASLLKIRDSFLGGPEEGGWSVHGSGIRPCLTSWHDLVDQPESNGSHGDTLYPKNMKGTSQIYRLSSTAWNNC